MTITAPQQRALQALAALDRPTAREVARHLWPDSPAWNRRTRGRRTGTISGALGGTMPMNAAKMLHRLAALGLAQQVTDTRWVLTDAGRQAVQ